MALASPPGGISWALWPSFIPLMWACTRQGVGAAEAARLGMAGGLGIGMGGFFWMGELLIRYAEFSAFLSYGLLFLFSVWTAVPVMFWAVALNRGPRSGAWAWFWPPVTWVAFTQTWPSIFPYSITLGFVETPELMQLAELGGTPILEVLLVLVGSMVTWSLSHLGGRRGQSLLAVALLVLPLVTFFGGKLRMDQIDAEASRGRVVRVGLVQPNVPIGGSSREEHMKRLWRSSARVQREGAQMVVWPEAGIYPYGFDITRSKDYRDERRVLRGYRLPTIFGASTRAEDQPTRSNSAIFIDKKRRVAGVYHKMKLVPFGETVPLVDPEWALELVPAMSHLWPGESPARFAVKVDDEAPVHVAPLICYEDILTGVALDATKQTGGIELFANLTIDTWFADSPAAWEHLGLAQYRTVEHRIPMVRSVAAGPSGLVDAAGRVVAHLPLHAPEGDATPSEQIVVDVSIARNTEQQPTLFAKVGWIIPLTCQVVTAGLLLFNAFRRLTKEREAERHGSVPSVSS